MNLAVPTVMCRAMFSKDIVVGMTKFSAGEIVELPFGTALCMKALNGLTIVDENDAIAEAQEKLAIYGGDCWFAHPQQTISRVADYLAQAGYQTDTVN